VIDLAGTVALLLWGVHMVQSGILRAFGPDLRRFLSKALDNRLAAFAAGLGATAILQSSTAAGLIVASFCASGALELVPALAVMLGANLGTTLIVQVLSFEVARFAPLLVLIGVVVFRSGRAARARDLGRVAIGLGLMLLALAHLLEITTPHEDMPGFRLLMGALATDPLTGVIAATAFTWAAHSSVAVVLLVMSLTAKGLVPLTAALALVIGANIGSAINPVIEGARGADAVGRRLAIGNLLIRLTGALIALPVLGHIGPFLAGHEASVSRGVADFHTAFNLVLAILFLPLLGPLARLLRRVFARRIEPGDLSQPLYLDQSAISNPALALGSAAREVLRMADVLEGMLRAAVDALDAGDRTRIEDAKRLDDCLDALNKAVRLYLSEIDLDAMDADDENRLSAILTFATNLEHAGDILDRNVMSIASRRLKRGLAFSKEGRDEIDAALARLEVNLRTAATIFMSSDIRGARVLAEEKTGFRELEDQASRAHFRRLREGNPASTETSSLHLDLLRDLKRVNAHLIEGAAYPLLQQRGELRSTRLNKDVG
jgi:phosphate:Na+ symporter